MIFNYDADWPCFERGGGKVPDADILSDLPEEDEGGVTYHQTWRGGGDRSQMTRAEYLSYGHSFFPHGMVAPSHCPHACHGNGWCMAGGRCQCQTGWDGPECAFVASRLCLNGCSGAGVCYNGFCSCKPGLFGIDCSINLTTLAALQASGLSADITVEVDPPAVADVHGDRWGVAAEAEVAAQQLSREPQFIRPRVYVYELPPWLNLAHFADQSAFIGDGIYSGWRLFLEALLRDWGTRTLDPAEANLFYVPALTFAFTDNGGPPQSYVRRVADFLATEHPALWGRNNGSDHIFWAAGDRGACPLPEDEKRFIWMVHFGLTHWRYVNPEAPPDASCFDPTHGVVVAPYFADGEVRPICPFLSGVRCGVAALPHVKTPAAGELACDVGRQPRRRGRRRRGVRHGRQPLPRHAVFLRRQPGAGGQGLAVQPGRAAGGAGPGPRCPPRLAPHPAPPGSSRLLHATATGPLIPGSPAGPRCGTCTTTPPSPASSSPTGCPTRAARCGAACSASPPPATAGASASARLPPPAASRSSARRAARRLGRACDRRLRELPDCARPAVTLPPFSQEGIHQPGDDVLPYHEFSLRLGLEDMPNLAHILRSYSPADIARLQRGLRRHHRAFVWTGPRAGAYKLAIRSLKAKLYNLQARFPRRRSLLELAGDADPDRLSAGGV